MNRAGQEFLLGSRRWWKISRIILPTGYMALPQSHSLRFIKHKQKCKYCKKHPYVIMRGGCEITCFSTEMWLCYETMPRKTTPENAQNTKGTIQKILKKLQRENAKYNLPTTTTYLCSRTNATKPSKPSNDNWSTTKKILIAKNLKSAEKYVLGCENDQMARFLNISAVVENVNPVIKQRMHKGWIFDIQYWLLAMKADKCSNISEQSKS